MLQNLHVLLICENMQNPLRLPRKTKSERPKMLRTRQFLTLLIAKRASRHNGVHFFRHQLPKVVRGWCVLYIGLPNVLRATTACTFSTSQLPKVLRTWSVFSFFTCKRASRHNGVHFFDISTSKSGPNIVCFVHDDFQMCFAPQRRATCHLSSEPHGSAPAAPVPLTSRLFDPPEPQISGKTQCFSTLLPFRALASSFLRLFFLLWSSLFCSSLAWLFPLLLFHMSILSEVWLLNFLRSWDNYIYVYKLGIKWGFIGFSEI